MRLLFEATLKVLMTKNPDQPNFESYSMCAVSCKGAKLLVEAQKDPSGELYKKILEEGIVSVATAGEGYKLKTTRLGWALSDDFFQKMRY